MASYYSVLAVPDGASLDDIKAAYRRKLLQLHPDKQQLGATTGTSSTCALAEVQEAFDVLKDPQKRTVYDSKLRSEQLRCRFEGIPWMTIKLSEMEIVVTSDGSHVYEYECRCGGVFEMSTDCVHHLAEGPAQLTCFHCTSSLEVIS